MVALSRFLLLCAAVLAFPVFAIAQSTPLAFEVESTKGWQATALIVRQGQALSLSAESVWSVDYRNFSFVGPEGYSPSEDGKIYQGCKLDPTIPYGVLLVKVGDNPNFELVGRGGEFVASYDGPVSFRIHDGDACLGDNAGSVKVTVTAAESLPIAQGAPFFVCLSGPRSVCQGAYSHPVQDPLRLHHPRG